MSDYQNQPHVILKILALVTLVLKKKENVTNKIYLYTYKHWGCGNRKNAYKCCHRSEKWYDLQNTFLFAF